MVLSFLSAPGSRDVNDEAVKAIDDYKLIVEFLTKLDNNAESDNDDEEIENSEYENGEEEAEDEEDDNEEEEEDEEDDNDDENYEEDDNGDNDAE